uniref:RNA binding motif protein 43 n=1 Tax=Sphenodon punctatus TaxID=8508 RepID=A0A8D0G9E9_SPHPU
MATPKAGKLERSLVVCGIPDGILTDDVMANILIIHFQKPKNWGGDVEDVVYPTITEGVAYVIFEEKKVAEKVLKKGEHRLTDKRLPRDYPLKVSPYGESVFPCVSSTLDLSVFGDKYILEELVQELQKNLTVLSFGPLQSNGHILVQGPFSAVTSLKNSLLLKANSLLDKVKKGGKESNQIASSRMQKYGSSRKQSKNFVQDTNRKEQVVVLDTDVYRYMEHFYGNMYKKQLQKYGVASHVVTDGEITTMYLESNRSDPSHLQRAKEVVENLSMDLQRRLRKEKIIFEANNRTEHWKYTKTCEHLKFQYPKVLVIPYTTHIDIIGSSSEIYKFVQEVNETISFSQKGRRK